MLFRSGVKQDKASTLIINFDQTAPQVYIESPVNAKPFGTEVDVRGAVLPGWAAKVDVVDAVEGIMLIGQREKESFTPQRFGSFREDGTEALHVPHVDPERGVEVVAIARGG